MRVAYVITRAERGGAQVHLRQLAAGLQSRLEMVVLVGEDGFLVEECRRLGVPAMVVPELSQSLRPWRDIQAVMGITRRLRRLRPDLVHAHSSKAGFLGRMAARQAGVPAVFTAHGWAFADGTPVAQRYLARPVERVATAWSKRIITVSRADYELAARLAIAPPRKLVVVHNGIPDTPLRASPGRSTQPVVVMVARFTAQKDHELVIRALSRVGEGARLVLVGDGPLRGRAQDHARSVGIARRVDFVGTRGDVDAILAGAHIAVLGSRWEGLPLAVLEAMRAGLPVIATDVGGVSEAVSDGRTGFLVAPGAESALADRLQRLIIDPALRARMGAAGRTDYEARFTSKRMLEQTLAVYHAALGTSSDP